jgi:hypothetical protein
MLVRAPLYGIGFMTDEEEQADLGCALEILG